MVREPGAHVLLHLSDLRVEEVDCLLDILYTGTRGPVSRGAHSIWTVYNLLQLDERGGLPKPQKWVKAPPGQSLEGIGI